MRQKVSPPHGCSSKDYLGEVEIHLYLDPLPIEKNSESFHPLKKFSAFRPPTSPP